MSRRIWVATAILIPLLWTLPIITGYLESNTPDKIFLGWMRSDDFHRYGSFIEQTAEYGRILYKDYSTVQPQHPRMIATYFTVLGWVKIITGWQSQHLWLISRLIVGGFFVLLLRFVLKKHFTDNESILNIALLFVFFSCGWEWIAHPMGVPLPRIKNFWMDGFSTFNSFHNPLKIAGLAFGLLFLHFHLQFERSGRCLKIIPGILTVLLIWSIHPNSAICVYFGLAALTFIPVTGKQLGKGLLIRWIRMTPYLIPVALIWCYVGWMKTDPMTANIIKQYHVPFSMEPLWAYPIRYGLVLPFGIWGLISCFKRKTPFDVMLAGWLAGSVFFCCYPYMTGLLFQHMIHLPLAIFAAKPFYRFIVKLKKPWRYAVLTFCMVTFAAGDVYALVKTCWQTKHDVWPTSLYASESDLETMKILRNLPSGNVLVNRDTGNKIGWLALHNVFLGHWGTTPDKGRKIKELELFYNPATTTGQREELLRRYNIRYLWYGRREQQLGPLDHRLLLTPVAQNSDVTLFQVGYKYPISN